MGSLWIDDLGDESMLIGGSWRNSWSTDDRAEAEAVAAYLSYEHGSGWSIHDRGVDGGDSYDPCTPS